MNTSRWSAPKASLWLLLASSALAMSCSGGKFGGKSDSDKKSASLGGTQEAGAEGADGTNGDGTAGSGSGSGSGDGSNGASSSDTCAKTALTDDLALHGHHDDDDDDKDHDDDKDYDKGEAADACQEQNRVSDGIKKCLKAWGGKSPFNEKSEYRKIAAAVSVLGVNGNAINDDQASAGPELVVIAAAVSVLSTPTYRLVNPNGWYCIIADVNVGSKLTVDLHKTAHLADSRVNVSVASNGQAAGAVDVNVFSNVKVNRVDK